jgi:Zyg-11 family protein
LSDASRLTKTGLKVLKNHPVTELEAHGLTKATVTDLIGCLGEWSVLNLKKLDVTNSTFVDRHKYTISVALTKVGR